MNDADGGQRRLTGSCSAGDESALARRPPWLLAPAPADRPTDRPSGRASERAGRWGCVGDSDSMRTGKDQTERTMNWVLTRINSVHRSVSRDLEYFCY